MAERRKYWDYTPSLPAAVILSASFAILTLFHIVKLSKTRTWFCVPLIVGGIFETIGFACRGVGHSNMYILVPYIIQALLILLAPILFAASVYMLLGRLIRATAAEEYSLIRVDWVTKIFVGGDTLCFLIQAAGGGILASAKTSSTRKMGDYVILGGLILQIVIFGFFLLIVSVYHSRMRAKPTTKSLDIVIDFSRFMTMLYVVSVLITLRNLFRVIEYAMGKEGYLLANEWPLYIFDALLMVFVLAICSTWYVGRLEAQSDNNDINLSQAEAESQKPSRRRHRK